MKNNRMKIHFKHAMTSKHWDSILMQIGVVWKQKSLELFPLFTCVLKHCIEHDLMAYATSKDDTKTLFIEVSADKQIIKISSISYFCSTELHILSCYDEFFKTKNQNLPLSEIGPMAYEDWNMHMRPNLPAL